jgi:Immunoglobulin domain
MLAITPGFRTLGATNVAAPIITTQPESQTALAGTNVTFTVGVTNTTLVTYQWFFNSSAIVGATNASLQLANVQSPNRGFYHVLIYNLAGAVASQTAFLVPYSISVSNVGGTIRFSTIGGGANAVIGSYFGGLVGDQWIAQLYAGPGPNAPVESLVPVWLPAPFRKGLFRGYVTGGTRFIPFVPPGSTGTFQVRVWNVNDGYTYEEARARWLSGTNAGAVGTTGPINIITGIDADSAGTLAGLGVSQLGYPEFRLLKVPTNQIAFLGGTVSFAVETLSYSNLVCCFTNVGPFRWKKNGLVIPGLTAPVLTLTNIQLSDAATYNVAVYDYQWVDSPPYSLTVLFPYLLSPRLSPSGQLEATVLSQPGALITIEASSNLVNWASLASFTNTTGSMQFTDSSGANDPWRFYRARVE